MRKIPNKVLVQARVKPTTRKELERRAAKEGVRFCTYLAQELERLVAPPQPVQWSSEITGIEGQRL